MKKGKTNRSSDDAAAAAPLVAGNDGSRSSVARPHLSSSPTVLARAGLVVAEVVRHLHRVHQRGATAVLVLVLVEERKRVFYFCFEEERFLSLSLLSFSLSLPLSSLSISANFETSLTCTWRSTRSYGRTCPSCASRGGGATTVKEF